MIFSLLHFPGTLTHQQSNDFKELYPQPLRAQVETFKLPLFPTTEPAHDEQDIPLDDPTLATLKRVFDVLFSASVLLFIFPVMLLVIGFLIKRDSPGPIFYRQKRTGHKNKTFSMWKFRTMRVNKLSDTVQATSGDSRITKIGAFLRSSSLDEFPQFINVFMGEMSVVGPRPHMVAHTTYYSSRIENYLQRHDIKPGVTGLAQIKGFRGPTEELWKMERRVDYDLQYLRDWNFFLDCKCILKTVANVMGEEENAL
ncbi:sugar transferase [Neolewinella antarctica]|uniref:Lipopolysaccharide/colanic/teichoic acid biosynthesis glycosyltransferase n=1 Tax=Neolewinella antarctica TaxID=442734 RepID=A0ABX0XBP3_9BACT|nr:sugar transferase [Neolewinella antarctica]NJC26253.1 lipopolysaccharide/colanic/teichoic acid biosynthesis glycosyltransferase [Neolewinella antarctica]